MQNQKSALAMDDDLLSQADIILPSQYFGSIGSVGLSAEQRLMLAVLVDAVNVLQSWRGAGSAHERRDFAEAAHWVNTRGTSHPFSFDSVCDALEINSELLRSRLRVLTVRPANSPRPTLARLRLKELSRRQQMTANRQRRRTDLPRSTTALTECASAPSSAWEHTDQAQDCIAEASTGLAVSGDIFTDLASAPSMS